MSETPAQTSAPEKKRSHSKKPSSDNGQRPEARTKPKAQEQAEMSAEEKMAAFVARAKKNWKESVEAAKTQQEYVNKPDGNYILRLTGADYGVGGNGKLRIMWMYTCLEGKQLGETFFDFSNLEQDDAETWLASKLHRLGVDIDEYDPAQLEETLKALIEEGSAYAVTLKSKPSKNDPDKTFQQFFINKKLGADYEPDITDTDDGMAKLLLENGKTVNRPVGILSIVEKADKEDDDEEDEEDDEEDDDDDEEVELKEGSRVEFRWKGEDKGPGVVKSIDAESGIVRISFEKKVYPVKVDAISVLDDEDDDDDDEDETPAKKKGKK